MRIFWLFGILISLLFSATYGLGQSEEYQQEDPEGSAIDSDQQIDEEDAKLENQQSQEAEEMEVADSPKVRRFHEVLDELLAEFGYDVKMGQIKGLKNVAIRKVTVNDSLPHSYKSYMELLVAERIRENSQVRIISCVVCKNKSSRVIDGKLIITSPSTNMAEMNRAAKQLGIDNFMDVVLVYHSTHMVLAFQVFDTDSKELVWARTYNSETIKSRFQKLAVDYRQVQKSRPGEDYVPEFRYLIGLGGAGVPNVAGGADDSGMMMAHFRGTEKFDNRHSEFGLILNIYQSTNNLLSDYPTTGDTSTDDNVVEDEVVVIEAAPEPFTSALGIYVMYGYNFIGSIESYNRTRHGVSLGGGILAAAGYVAGTLRLGWDVYFGRSFGMVFGGLYVAPSKILVDSNSVETAGGTEGEVSVVYNF